MGDCLNSNMDGVVLFVVCCQEFVLMVVTFRNHLGSFGRLTLHVLNRQVSLRDGLPF